VATDKPAVTGVVILYIVLVLGAVPAHDYSRILASTAVLITLLWVIDRVWRTEQTPPFSIMIVSFIGAGVLVMPAFGAMGGDSAPALPVSFVGALVVTMWWVSLRWRVSEKQPRQPLWQPILFAVLGALVLSIIATVPILIMLAADRSQGVRLMLVYVSYFGGAILAAVVFWVLQGIAHRPLGRYLIAGLAGTCLYAAVGPVVSLVEGDPIILSELLGIGAGFGFLVGPPVAFLWWAVELERAAGENSSPGQEHGPA
jgi:hypothetical protein